MNEPPILPHIVRMRFTDREIEHLLGLLDGDDVGDDAQGAVGLLDFIANLEVACAHPLCTQVRMAFRLRPGRGVSTGTHEVQGNRLAE